MSSRFRAGIGDRLRWRVIVRTVGRLDSSRAALPLAWHLVECADPLSPGAHCPQGQQLIADGADPDGHCLIGGVCPRDVVLEAAL